MALDVVQVAANAARACDGLGEIELGGIKLESCDPELLNLLSDKFTLDQHVAMQPSAIGFYGMMKKVASRRLGALEREYDRWEKKKVADARMVCDNLSKKEAKLESVKGRFQVDNEVEINRFEARLAALQEQSDSLDSWFEAWKAKGFAIREHAAIEESESFQSPSIKGTGGEYGNQQRNVASNAKIQNVRDIIRRSRDGSLQGGSATRKG